MGEALLTVTPNDSPALFFASHPRDFMLYWPRGPGSKGRNASTKRHNDSIELEVKTATSHSGLLMALNQQGKKGVTMLAG